MCEINRRLYNKHHTNNAVHLVQFEKNDKLVYILLTYLLTHSMEQSPS